ncbi:MAG: hypothetical protein K2L47_02860 [Clostridia bacterium]|nr:hypothetical protein [Clostridia bacterium]
MDWCREYTSFYCGDSICCFGCNIICFEKNEWKKFETNVSETKAIKIQSGYKKSTLLSVLSGIDEKSDGEKYIFGKKCNPSDMKFTFVTIYLS